MPEPFLANLPRVLTGGTLAEQLYDVIEEAIISGELGPGQRLPADDLARHFGVSRIPIRETLRALDANGWVDIRPRHGACVRQRTERELRSLFEVRSMLEVQSVQLAAERRSAGQLKELDLLVEQGRQAAASARHGEVAAINTRFHNLVAECAGNEVLAEILEGLGKRVRWYFGTVGETRGRQSMREHADIVKALRDGDRTGAAALVAAHIDATRDAVQEAVIRELRAGGAAAEDDD